jgi:hypothetical protein
MYRAVGKEIVNALKGARVLDSLRKKRAEEYQEALMSVFPINRNKLTCHVYQN